MREVSRGLWIWLVLLIMTGSQLSTSGVAMAQTMSTLGHTATPTLMTPTRLSAERTTAITHTMQASTISLVQLTVTTLQLSSSTAGANPAASSRNLAESATGLATSAGTISLTTSSSPGKTTLLPPTILHTSSSPVGPAQNTLLLPTILSTSSSPLDPEQNTLLPPTILRASSSPLDTAETTLLPPTMLISVRTTLSPGNTVAPTSITPTALVPTLVSITPRTDICNSSSTDQGHRGSFFWVETTHDTTLTVECPLQLMFGELRYASRHCADVTRAQGGAAAVIVAEWKEVDVGNCPSSITIQLEILSRIIHDARDPPAILNAGNMLANLTSSTDVLISVDVDFASVAILNIVSAVSGANSFDQSIGRIIADSILAAIDNLLMVPSSAISAEAGSRVASAMGILVTFLEVGVGAPLERQQANIGFLVNCPASANDPERFRVLSSQFSLSQVSTPAAESNAAAAMDLPAEAISNATTLLQPSNTSLCALAQTQYIVYRTHSLFQDSTLAANTSVASLIVAAQVGRTALRQLRNPVTLAFDLSFIPEPSINDEVDCVAWNFSQNNGRGAWSGDGCNVVTSSTLARRAVCQCNHLTNFAVLLSRRPAAVQSVAEEALQYVSIVGCSITMVVLMVAVIIIVSVKTLREKKHHQMILGLSVTLLIFLAIFTAVLYDRSIINTTPLCRALAIILHYLLLCAFMWMSVDATYLYQQIIVVFNKVGQERYNKVLYLLIFVIPLGIVIISAGASKTQSYQRDQVCWIGEDAVFYAGLVAPMAISFLYNMTVLVMVLRAMRRRAQRRRGNSKTTADSNKHLVRITVILSGILGVTWVFGFLILAIDTVALQYLFTISNVAQGVLIFAHSLHASEVGKNIAVRRRSSSQDTITRKTSTSRLPSDTLQKSDGDARSRTSTLGRSLPDVPMSAVIQPGDKRDRAGSRLSRCEYDYDTPSDTYIIMNRMVARGSDTDPFKPTFPSAPTPERRLRTSSVSKLKNDFLEMKALKTSPATEGQESVVRSNAKTQMTKSCEY